MYAVVCKVLAHNQFNNTNNACIPEGRENTTAEM
jgi:hypothetical protein